MKNKIIILVAFIFITFFVVFKFSGFDLSSAQNNFNNITATTSVSLLFVGDIMLSRGVNYELVQLEKSTTSKEFLDIIPFQNIASVTRKYDLTIGNLETPIVANGKYGRPDQVVFNTNPKYIKNLKNAGFDILTLANNHSMDKGLSGASSTMSLLAAAGIDSFGIGDKCHEGIIKEVNGIKIGFLGYSYTAFNHTLYSPDKFVCDLNDFETVKKDVKNILEKVDVVVVYTHSGIEYEKAASAKDVQKMRALIDVGVKVVVNTHPHVIQRTEKYKDGVIAYSLGNFVFDQERESNKKGKMLEVQIENKNIKSYKDIPIYIKNFCCPEILK